MAPSRLVVLDDHVLFRAGLVSLIRQEKDLEVVAHARTAEAARPLDLPWDLLVLDAFPRMGGGPEDRDAWQLLLRVRELWPDRPLLVLSGEDAPAAVGGACRRGVRAYVLKTAVWSEVLAAVRAVLRGSVWFDPRVAGSVVLPNPDGSTATPREKEVLALVRAGLRNSDIARELGLSLSTVKTHVRKLFSRYGVESRLELTSRLHDHPLHPDG